MAQNGLRTWAILSAATLGLCVNLGCEKLESEATQSERHVDQVARKAVQEEEAQQPALYNAVATDVTGKSDVATARARQLQAQAEYNAGTQMMRQAANQANELSMRMINIDHLISTIQTSNALVAGYGQYDSAPIKKEASQEIAQIQGSGDEAAWVAGKNPVPSISAVKQTISKLQIEIRQKQDQIAELARERQTALSRSEDLSEKADQATGPAWVSLYKQASNLRKKASDISTHIDNVTASIEPLQVQLAIAQSNLQIAEAAIKGIRIQADGAESNFAEVQKGAHGQDEIERNVYENAMASQKEGGASLKSQLDSLMDQAKQVQTTWDAAAKLLNDSAEHFAAAQSAAEALQVRLQDRAVEIQGDVPEKAAWDELKKVYNTTTFQYDRGVSLQTLGMLCADELASLKQLAALKARAAATLTAAKLDVPASISSANFNSAIQQAADTGKQAFATADGLFQNVSNAPLASASERNGGRVARVLELYGWYQFGLLTGDDQASTHLSAARDAIKDATDNGAALPILPAEIQPQIAMPPGMGPATEPAGATAAVSGAPADAATIAAIKQSAHDAVTAMQSGDAAQIKQFLITPPEMADSMDSIIALMTSSIHLQKSATAKFGDQAKTLFAGKSGMNMDMPSPEKIDAMIAQASFASTGPDAVSMTVPGSPNPIPLKKNGNEWAIDLTTAMKDQPQAAAMMPMLSKMFQPMADGMNQIAADVDAGKYQNVDQVRTAMNNMMGPIAQQMMGGPRTRRHVTQGAGAPPAGRQ